MHIIQGCELERYKIYVASCKLSRFRFQRSIYVYDVEFFFFFVLYCVDFVEDVVVKTHHITCIRA